MRIDEQILANATWQLDVQFKGVEDLVHYWALFGPCIYNSPPPEQSRPWFDGFENLFPKVKFKR